MSAALSRRISVAAAAAALGFACPPLGAAGPARKEAAPVIDVTDAASVLYNFDNRDTRPGQVASVANDHWGLLYNRLNAQVASARVTLSLRADNAWFFTSPTPVEIADELASLQPLSEQAYRAKLTEAGIELSNRYINQAYPAKYSLSYGTPDLEILVGDTYAQFGRGLVLSVRKLDEISSDTTLRGVRLGARFGRGSTRARVTAVGGSMNPLRLDDASGRYLATGPQSGFLAFTEAGMPGPIETDFAPYASDCNRFATCSYAPDLLFGGQFELTVGKATFGTQLSALERQDALGGDTVRSAQSIVTASQSVELLNLVDHLDAYAEVATQKLDHEGEGAAEIAQGYALYGTVGWHERRFSLVGEGKHYRRLFPLLANVSTARAREFSAVQYSAPPTTEEVWNDTQFGNFNTCVSGGRVKGEAHLDRGHSASAWVGRYVSWSESASNDNCDDTARANHVWDLAVGFEARPQSRPARWQVTTGSRFDDVDRELAGPDGRTSVFYRELFVRYQISEPIGGGLTLEVQGVHRRRRETVGGPAEDWLEGQQSTGIDWGEKLSGAIGVEYDTRPEVAPGYLNVMFSYRPIRSLSLALFAGQRRGSLRCVGGVCRVYPPFEGARLDATFRY